MVIHIPTSTGNAQHVQRRLAGLTPDQHRRRLKQRKLPPGYVVPTEPLPVAAGRISLTRSGQVSPNGNVHLLSQTFKLGKRLKGE